ncbi:uncharacterized protein LOC135691794 isoform X2 [Rhopilema esculentum]|uniref:uncharacterized protein LOC135691794 isoform X2 n=1 Tax=Rhopilema esculentum TaxID=499914 RepID=UPI0031D6FBF1
MSAFRRRGKFTFKRVGSRLEGKAKNEEKEESAVPKSPKRNGNFVATSIRNLRQNPYKDFSKFESPAKRTKIANNDIMVGELYEDIDEFDNDIMIDLDNDDFSKDLTVDYLNTLEVEASQQMQEKIKPTKNSMDEVHTFISVKNCQEKTLDLFSTGQTVDRTIVDKKQRQSATHQPQAEINDYKDKFKTMEESMFAKDGEIKILRQNLGRAQEERDNLRTQIQKIERNTAGEKSESQKRLEREIEKLQTQLQFKNKEIQDIKESRHKYNSIKDAEKIAHLGTSAHPSPSTSRTISLFDNTTFAKRDSASPNMRKAETKKLIEHTDHKYKLLNAAKKRFDIMNHGQIQIEKELLHLIAAPLDNISYSDKNLPELNFESEADLTGSMGNSFIHQCILELQGMGLRSTVSIVEMIEPHLAKLSQYVKDISKPRDVDLLCEESEDVGNNCIVSNVEKGNPLRNKTELKFGIVVLSVLRITVKHDVSIQGYFLESLNNNQKGTKDHNQSSKVKICNYHDQLKPPKPLSDTVELENFEDIMNHLSVIVTYKQCPDVIKESIFEVLVSLSSSCRNISKIGLVKMLEQGKLLSTFLSNMNTKKISALLAILKVLSVTDGFESILCSGSANCPLNALYKVFVKKLEDCTELQWKDVKLEVVHTVSTIISCCPKSLRVILDSDCECRSELTKSLVLMLFKEYKDIRKDYLLQDKNHMLMESKMFLLLRQGMSLLSLVSLSDKNFMDHRVEVEWQYLDLIYGTIRLYRRIPSISENEVLMVQDLRDIDQYDDFEESEDGPQTDFPMDQN